MYISEKSDNGERHGKKDSIPKLHEHERFKMKIIALT